MSDEIAGKVRDALAAGLLSDDGPPAAGDLWELDLDKLTWGQVATAEKVAGCPWWELVVDGRMTARGVLAFAAVDQLDLWDVNFDEDV